MDKYERRAKTFRTIGTILLVIGVPLFLIAAVDLIYNGMNFQQPKLFFLGFIGLPCAGIGGMFLALGSQRQIAEYSASQQAPVAKKYANYMIHETSDSIAEVAGKVTASTKTSVVEGVTGNKCEKCGTINPANATFCSNCGAKIVIVCECGTVNDDGAKYCNGCGKKLR